MQTLVSIIMGSDSDLPVLSEAAKVLKQFEIPFEIKIVSAHRTPERMFEFAKEAHNRGVRVIIAGAGGSAHLPGMVAALTPLPVIGVPVMTKTLEGQDSLYSIVQMPPGIPVATVAINGAQNAGLLAAKILGSHDDVILKKVVEFSKQLEATVMKKAEKLEAQGYETYLSEMKG